MALILFRILVSKPSVMGNLEFALNNSESDSGQDDLSAATGAQLQRPFIVFKFNVIVVESVFVSLIKKKRIYCAAVLD